VLTGQVRISSRLSNRVARSGESVVGGNGDLIKDYASAGGRGRVIKLVVTGLAESVARTFEAASQVCTYVFGSNPPYAMQHIHVTLILAVGAKAQKLPLPRIDLGEICSDEVIAAALAGDHLKTTVHEGRGGACAAEMDECGEILLLLRACRGVWRAGKNRRDIVVQVHGRELNGMARDRPGVEAGEPTVGIYHSIPSDTVACRLGVSSIGHLVHADSARGGLVHSEGIPSELPAPVGARHRIAGAFDLRQRGQQLGRDRARGIGVEERSVLSPRFDRFLIKRPADEKEQFARLADNVVNEVCQR